MASRQRLTPCHVKRCNILTLATLPNERSAYILGAVVVIVSLARETPVLIGICMDAPATGSVVVGAMAAIYYGSRQDLYNILWAVVFGFATLNILGLASRRMEPGRRGLSFGEMMAVMVVLVSIFLLGWELVSLLHIFPIKLRS